MVRVTIRAIWGEGHNDLWFDAANVGDNFADNFTGICLIHITINVIEKVDFSQTQMFGGALQLCCTDASDAFQAGVWTFTLKPATLPMCGADKIRLYIF